MFVIWFLLSHIFCLCFKRPLNFCVDVSLIYFQTDYGPLKTLTASGMLKPHSRKCRCSICRDESPKTTPEKIRSKKRSTLSDDDENDAENEEEEKDDQMDDTEPQDEEENVSFWSQFLRTSLYYDVSKYWLLCTRGQKGVWFQKFGH